MKKQLIIILSILAVLFGGFFALDLSKVLVLCPKARLWIHENCGYITSNNNLILSLTEGGSRSGMLGLWTGSRTIEESKQTGAFVEEFHMETFKYHDSTATIVIPAHEAFIEYQQYYDGTELKIGTANNLIITFNKKDITGRKLFNFHPIPDYLSIEGKTIRIVYQGLGITVEESHFKFSHGGILNRKWSPEAAIVDSLGLSIVASRDYKGGFRECLGQLSLHPSM